MFFVRYDVDGNFEFNNEETGRILDDIDHDRMDRAPEGPDVGDITRYAYNSYFISFNYSINSFNDSKYKIILYLISRPKSGKQAREQRSKSIMSLFAGADEGGRGNVSSEEFNM